MCLNKPGEVFQRDKAAFTLLEVLVASAIMGIVMFVLVSTANTSLQLWRGTSEKIAVDREGRSGMALLAWDLQNIVQPTNINLRPHLQTTTANNPPPEIPLRFLTRKPVDYQNAGDLSDVCFVEYRFRDNALLRGFVGGNETLSALTNATPRFPTPTSFDVLATNLYQFRVWGYQSNSSPVTYSSQGIQSDLAQTLRSIEYRMEVVDQKYMKMYRTNDQLARAQGYKSRKFFQAIEEVPPPQ